MSARLEVSNHTQPVHIARWRNRISAVSGLAAALVVVVILATTFGSVRIPPLTTFQILSSKLPWLHPAVYWPAGIETVILDIRLPRVILAGLVGAGLSVAGGAYQGLFRNPLADPYLIGVAQGAALGAVAGFGLCMIGFALSSNFWLAGALLVLSGVFDGVSVVMRTTILQLATPDAMRGRVSAINGIFIGSSNELGAFESGVMARLMGLVPSVVFGGVMTLTVVAATAKWAPKLRKLELDQLH